MALLEIREKQYALSDKMIVKVEINFSITHEINMPEWNIE